MPDVQLQQHCTVL